MKRVVAFVVGALIAISASAKTNDTGRRKMLEEGKTWTYYYHNVCQDTSSETGLGPLPCINVWPVEYELKGDTMINDRQYMKMYRYDMNANITEYFGAFREDDEGRVYMYSDYDKKDQKMIDFSLDFDETYITPPDTILTETIKPNGKSFRRYRYIGKSPDGNTYDMGYTAVEGVGYQDKGLVHYIFAPEPDCLCDYETLAYVNCKDFRFDVSGFGAPKEIELTDSERQLIASNNDFAFNLFRRARGDENCVLSPLSITYALGMLNNAADGQTQQEINQTLGFGTAGAEAINAFCQKMLKEAGTLDDKTKALIANTVFVNEGCGYQLQDGFIKKANDYYNAEPQNRDFKDGETMDVINQWANDHTEGMIPQVLTEESFNPSCVSYLLNALYFKGIWSDPFDIAETKEEPFGNSTPVLMMHRPYTEFEYNENNLYQAVNLPYGNGAYRMSVFLPREGKTIGEVLESLNGSNWQLNGYYPEMDLKLPRFETDTKKNLVDIMSDLGMPTAFTLAAEFPYFCNEPVFIQNMFQVAKIKLDEEGTEAAAVTVIEMEASAIGEFVDFHANRPFFYIISEQSTGAIFFIGQYVGDLTASISAPQRLSEQKDVIYNLQGQRLSAPPARGLYIKNGKKVLR